MLSIIREELNVAIYCRLSREDGDTGESSSIKTQREILVDYANKNNWNVYNIYTDDGYSGGNFNRPGWKALINDVETGIIDVVMTKDLSRLGRNYIEAGYYTEEYFPEKGVRFIALNDNYDSEKEDNDLTPFMNIINQWYLKDLSKKVKQSNHNRMKKGLLPKNISIPFYGFKLNDKNERVICEETARVVRKIFELYLTSKSPAKIVQYLFENKIPTPAYYNYLTYGYNPKEWINATDEKKYTWHRNIITKIISSEEYIGHLILNKKTTISYKTHKRVNTKSDKKYYFENVTDQIIDEDTFNKAQEIRKNRIFQEVPVDINRYKNLVYCGCCGKPLALKHMKAYPQYRTKESYSYACRKQPNNPCDNRLGVRIEMLDKVIFDAVEKMIAKCLREKENLREYAQKYHYKGSKKNSTVDDTELEKLKARNNKLDILIQRLFEKNAEGGIPKETYLRMMDSYNEEFENNKLRIEELKKKLASLNKEKDYVKLTNKFIERIEEAEKLEINRDVLLSLIDKIYIYKTKDELIVQILYHYIPEMLEDYFDGK